MEKATVIVGLVASCRSGFEMNGAGDKKRYFYVARATNQRLHDFLTPVSFTGRSEKTRGGNGPNGAAASSERLKR